MKQGILAVAMVWAAVAAGADEASHRQLAEQALSMMDVQKNIEQSFDAMKKMHVAQLKNMNLSAGDVDKARVLQDEVISVIQEEFSWAKIKEDYVKIYMDTFTEDELTGLIEFYTGPVGRKFVEKTPELMQRSVAVSQKQMATITPKIQEIMKKSIAASRPVPVPPAPPAAPGP